MKPQLHITGLNTMSRCGEQFRRRYIEGEIIPPGAAALVGKATDRSVTANLRAKMAGEALCEAAIEAAARDALNEEWEREGVRLEEGESPARARGDAVDKAVRLARLHWRVVAPRLRPTHVQRAWTLELRGFPLDLAGALDIQEADAVRDTKTTKKSPKHDAADTSDQLTCYALAVGVLDGAPPAHVVLDHLVDLKTPKHVEQVSSRTTDDFRVLLARVEVASDAIDKGVFIPARQDEWICSRKWCGYFDSCRYARGVTRATVGDGLAAALERSAEVRT